MNATSHAAELYEQLIEAFDRREWRRSLDLAAKLLPVAPRHAGVCYVAGISLLELKQLPQAISFLQKATSLEPERADYAAQLAKALVIARRNRDAKIVAEHAISLPCNDHLTLDTLGVVFSQIGSFASAAATFTKVVDIAPDQASYRYNLATALIAAGQIASAEVECEASLTIDPKYWRAHMTLAQLRRVTPEDNHVDRLISLLDDVDAAGPDLTARTCLNMALSKEYEDLGEYPGALRHLTSAKTAAGSGRRYSFHHDEEIFSAMMETISSTEPSDGCPTQEPIFVIGMPRSGTTLVERIISNHPEVHSAGELLNFPMSLQHLSISRSESLINADVIGQARDVSRHKLGEIYLQSTRPETGHTPRFLDKLPHNFLYAGFIAQALPNAKIVCLRRNPMDTCLSNFRQLFAPNSPFFDYSFDLLDVGRYYILFDRLMSHWQNVFPSRIFEVSYEAIVDAQELYSRQIIEFCDLPWNERCLRFEENPSPVATASAVQVRTPLYKSALGRWKKYGSQLDELHALLIEGGIDLRS